MTQSLSDENGLSFGGHLEELRHRIILGLLGVIAACGLTLYFGKHIVAWLCGPLMEAQRSAQVPTGTYTLSPIAGFAVYLKVSLVGAVILASPWILYQLWRFLESGLYPTERRVVLLLSPFSAAMTALGLSFMYYVMLPVCLWFLIAFTNSYPMVDASESSSVLGALATQPTGAATEAIGNPPGAPMVIPILTQTPAVPVDGQLWFDRSLSELQFHLDGQTHLVSQQLATLVHPLIEIGEYINFTIVLGIGVVVAFQLPVVMLILGWWNLIDPRLVVQYRKHCVLVCFAIGMLLTPADVLSMMLLAIPLWGLFEFGLMLMRVTYTQRDVTV